MKKDDCEYCDHTEGRLAFLVGDPDMWLPTEEPGATLHARYCAGEITKKQYLRLCAGWPEDRTLDP